MLVVSAQMNAKNVIIKHFYMEINVYYNVQVKLLLILLKENVNIARGNVKNVIHMEYVINVKMDISLMRIKNAK